MMAKRGSAQKTSYLKPKSAMKARGTLRSISTINNKPRQFQMIKINKEATLKTQETYFLYRKHQKLKTARNVFRKFISKN